MIVSSAKQMLRSALPSPVFDRLKMVQRRIQFARQRGFSEEEGRIAAYLGSLPAVKRYCVDIAAQDGIGGSQTLALFKSGWAGLAVEYDPRIFAVLAEFYSVFDDVALFRTKVTPGSVRDLLRSAGCPREFGFLSLDIDSYDYFVLDEILAEFRPALMCVEINEMMPPPLRFTVRYDPAHFWRGDHFQGQSISQCDLLCRKYDYQILELHYNNLILVARELNPHRALSVNEAYDAGYRNKPDRASKFPRNADVDALLEMTRDDAIAFVHRLFAAYAGRYILE
jgi:hypothetical protein